MKKGRERGPSALSLREIPEVDFKKAKVRRNPYAARIAREGIAFNAGMGRPKKGQETGPTIPRSVRFAAPVWKLLEQRAKEDGVSLHAALRAAVMDWVVRSRRRGRSTG